MPPTLSEEAHVTRLSSAGKTQELEGHWGCVSSSWDSLDPLLQCCNSWAWTNVSLSNKMQRNYMRLKITARLCSWGKFWTKRYKKTPQNPSSPEELGAKIVYQEQKQVLSTLPALNTTKGWTNHPSHPCRRTCGHTLTLTPYKEEVAHPLGEPASKVMHSLFLLPSASAGAQMKPCLDFLCDLQSISINWGRPKTLADIDITDLVFIPQEVLTNGSVWSMHLRKNIRQTFPPMAFI